MVKEIRIDGVIGEPFNTLSEIQLKVEALGLEEGDTLRYVISSEGGSVFEGYKIYNYFKTLPFNVMSKGEGLVGSIATLILLAPKKENTDISEVSMFMIHRALTGEGGNQEQLVKQAKTLKVIDETLISVYSERTGLSREEIEAMMSEETYLSGQEAVKFGFVGGLSNPIKAKATADAFYNLIKTNTMDVSNLLKRLRNEVSEEEKEKSPTEAVVKAETEEEKKEDEPSNIASIISNMTEEEKEEMKKALALEGDEDEVIEEEKIIEEEEAKEASRLDAMESTLTDMSSAIAVLLESNQAAVIENKVNDKFANLVAGLKSTKGAPKVGSPKAAGYVDPMAKHIAKMKDIEAKTRN